MMYNKGYFVILWCDLENRLGSFKVTGNDTNGLIAYEFLLAFHSNYGDIFLYRLRDIASYWSKIAIFLYPTGGEPDRISRRCLMLIKLELLGYRVVKKL